MKTPIILFLTLFCTTITLAQTTLNGVVLYQNSSGVPATGVAINSFGTSQVYTNDAGMFKLYFPNKKAGDEVKLIIGKEDKEGKAIEVVNIRQLEIVKIPSDPNDVLTIIVCPFGKRDEAALRFYDIFVDNINKGSETELKRLNDLLAQQNLTAETHATLIQQIKDLQQQKEEALAKAQEQAEFIASINKDQASDLVRQAIESIENGEDFEKALVILEDAKLEEAYQLALNQKIIADNKIKKVVEGYELKISLLIPQFRYNEVIEDYEKIIQIWTDNNFEEKKLASYYFNSAYYLQKQNNFDKAIQRYGESLEIRRALLKKNPEVYLPDIGKTLNNLAVLLSAKNELIQSQVYYEESLEIRRALSEKNPEVYLPAVGLTLNNLANLLSAKNELSKSQIYYEESLEIRRALSKKKPEVYLPDVGSTLNNLANLLSDKNELSKSQIYYEEALEIRRALSEKNPEVYLPDVGSTLNNLANLLSDKNELSQSQLYYKEALELYRVLSKKNPEVYLPYVAGMLNNLGILLRAKNELSKSQDYYEEALELYRVLSKKNPEVYLPDLALALNNLANLLSDKNDFSKAQVYYEESLEIRRELSKKNPEVYLPYVGSTLNNLAVLLSDKNELIQSQLYYEESLEIRRVLSEKNPDAYNFDVCETLLNMGLLYKEVLEQKGDMSLKREGISLMKECQKRLDIYDKTHPKVAQYQEYIAYLSAFFEDF